MKQPVAVNGLNWSKRYEKVKYCTVIMFTVTVKIRSDRYEQLD